MRYASHPERQFMQYLRGAGWIKARLLPPSRLAESLLRKGWIEQQQQGPNSDFAEWRDQEAWTAEKYRRSDRRKPMPPDWRPDA